MACIPGKTFLTVIKNTQSAYLRRIILLRKLRSLLRNASTILPDYTPPYFRRKQL